MGFDRDNPHKWFTAGEGAIIAQALQVPGVPWTRWGMTKHFQRLAVVDPDAHFDGPEGSEWHNVADPVHWTMEGIRVTGDYAGQLAYVIGQHRGWW